MLSDVGIATAIATSSASASPLTRELFADQWTAQRVAEFVNERRNATVATVNANGQPHAAVVIAASIRDEIYFTVHPESVLCRNINENDRIAISVCDSTHAVMCQGRAIRVGRASDLETLLGDLASVTRNGSFTPPNWDGFIYRIELHRLVAN